MNQVKEIDKQWFDGREREYDMFCARLELLEIKNKKEQVKKGRIKK